MRWSYKTVHFGLKKDGLLGSVFLDEAEIEISLNEYGHAGWELVSLMEVNDGLIAVFKQPLGRLSVSGREAPSFEETKRSEECFEEDEMTHTVSREKIRKAGQERDSVQDTEAEPEGNDSDDAGSIRIL